MGWRFSSALSTFPKHHANTPTELSPFKITQLVPFCVLERKGFGRSLSFDVKTSAFFCIYD